MATPWQNNQRRALIGKIHIGKAELRLDEDTYRQMLQGVTGKASCSLMNDEELQRVLAALQKRGFKVRSKFNENRPAPRTDRAPYLAKITALLAQHNLPQRYADQMAKQAFGIDFVHWLSVWQLKKVIQMLAVYDRRKKK